MFMESRIRVIREIRVRFIGIKESASSAPSALSAVSAANIRNPEFVLFVKFVFVISESKNLRYLR